MKNPYPRWIKLPELNINSNLSGFILNKKLNLLDDEILRINNPSVLVAGWYRSKCPK